MRVLSERGERREYQHIEQQVLESTGAAATTKQAIEHALHAMKESELEVFVEDVTDSVSDAKRERDES